MTNTAKIVIGAEDRTAGAFSSVGRRMDGLAGQAGELVGRLGGVAAALAAGVAAIEFKGVVDLLDKLDDMSEKSGIAVERLSELRYAGEATGTPLEALGKSASKLARNMADAAGGNKELAQAFSDLGIEIQDAEGHLRKTEDVIVDLAQRFAGWEDGPEKAAIAVKLFGKSGEEMIPLLNQGKVGIEALAREAKGLGAVFSEKATKAAAEFNDNLTKIRMAGEATKADLFGPLVESLAKVSSGYVRARADGQSFLDWYVNQSVRGLKNIFGIDQQAQPVGSAAIQAWVDKLGGPNAGGGRGFVNPKVVAPILQAPQTGGGGGTPKDPLAEAKRFLESLEKQLETTRGLGVEERALADIQLGRLGQVTPALEKQILATARLIDLEKAQKTSDKASEEAAKKAADDAARTLKAAEDFSRAVENPWEKLQRTLRENERLARDNPLINGEDLARANTAAWRDYLQTLEDVAEKTVQVSEEARWHAEEIRDFLGEGLALGLRGNFEDIGDAFGRMVERMILRAASAELEKLLFGDMLKGGSNFGPLGGWLANLFPVSMPSFDMYGGSTGATNSLLMSVFGNGVGSFDVGTDFVPRDMLAVVHKGERIVRAADNTGASGNTYINLTVGDVASMAQVRRAVADGVAAAQSRTVAGLARSRTYGGVA